MGGVIYLYKDTIEEFVKRNKWISLIGCWTTTCFYWFVPSLQGGFPFVITMSIMTVLWLCYAMGTRGFILNNRMTVYLSSISLEIYLCHMACYRVVGFLHLPNFIDDIYLVYFVSCILTILIAIIVSHIAKFYVLPLLSKSTEYLYTKLER